MEIPKARLVELHPGLLPEDTPLFGAAVDIGTTTVSLWLVDLISGKVQAQVAEYNQQISRGEDVISRIIYASKNNGLGELQALVVETVNEVVERAARRAKISPAEIYKMTVAGNSTMLHLFLSLPPNSIRLEPFITTINHPPPVRASELGLNIHPQASVDCLPGVASYVGADIPAGVIGTQMCGSQDLTLFLDVGTNGEMVLGDCEWLISCACSAGPAFEGGGVRDGVRATIGAIGEVPGGRRNGLDEAGVVEDITRRVAGDGHLRQYDQVGVPFPGRLHDLQAARHVALEVANDRVYLGEGDSHGNCPATAWSRLRASSTDSRCRQIASPSRKVR